MDSVHRRGRRRARLRRRNPDPAQDEIGLLPLPALAGLAFGFFGFFLASEVAFATRPHPIHWVVAAGGGALSYLAGLYHAHRTRR